MSSFREQCEELETQERYLVEQVAESEEFRRCGILRSELLAVQEKLSAVSVDTPTHDVINALQLEAALALRVSRGATELKRVKDEIRYVKEMERKEQLFKEGAEREKQKKIQAKHARIAEIDDLLEGRKVWPRIPLVNHPGWSIQDEHRKRVRVLTAERAELVVSLETSEPTSE
jgi:hypothetical protein